MVQSNAAPISAALCVTQEALTRLGRILRHLAVGFVDQAIQLRLLSSDPRVESLSLGPIQTIVHQKLRFPVAGRRLKQLLEVLSHQPPTVVHAMSSGSYRNAALISQAFDADLVLQATSLADCDAIRGLDIPGVGRYIASSRPIFEALVDKARVSPEDIELVRPGVQASSGVACFADTSRLPALLCTSELERGSGVDRLIEAIGLLNKRDVRLMVFLLGKGPQEYNLRRLIHRRGVSSSITLATPLGDLSQAMRSADIFVRPSADSAIFVSGLLAMAAGMVVITRPNTACDYYRDGETAIIYEKPTAAALADTIEKLIAERDYARRIATGAQEHVGTHHAMSVMADLTASVYRQLALRRATIAMKE